MKRLIMGDVISGTYNEYDEWVTIYKNPTSKEIEEIKKENNGGVRGVINEDGTMYAWNNSIIHRQINEKAAEPLNINIDNGCRFHYSPSWGWDFDMNRRFDNIKSASEFVKEFEPTLNQINSLQGEDTYLWGIDGIGKGPFKFSFYEKTAIIKRLKKQAYHSESTRDYALLYVDGKTYIDKDHGKCIEQFLKDNNIDLFESGKDEYTIVNERRTAFAHMVENEKAIYLMTDGLVLNMTLEECVNDLKRLHPDYTIYDDDNPMYNEEEDKNDYPKLANKRLAYHTNKKTKEWIDDRVETLLESNPDMEQSMGYGIAWNQYKKEHPGWEPKK